MNPDASSWKEYGAIVHAQITEIEDLADNINRGKYDGRLKDKVVDQSPFLRVEEEVSKLNALILSYAPKKEAAGKEYAANMEKAENKLLTAIISRADFIDKEVIGEVATSILTSQGASECVAKRKFELEAVINRSQFLSKMQQSHSVENFLSEFGKQPGVRIAGKESDDWHEIVFDDHPYNKKEIKTPWKIHIAPGQDMEALLNALSPVLLKEKPFCKIVPTDGKLNKMQETKDVNALKTYKGKCITIYPKTEDEAIDLALHLDQALSNSGLNPHESLPPCTDRPLGKSGYLWVRHDLAGGPIDEASFASADHAHANPGNYNVTVILPDKAYNFGTDEKAVVITLNGMKKNIKILNESSMKISSQVLLGP